MKGYVMNRAWVQRGAVFGMVGLLACSSNTEPPPPVVRDPTALNILQLAQNAPPLWNTQASFYAVRGEDREVRLFFQDSLGGQGEKYLRLRIDRASLLTRPDGTPFAVGDSILITVTVVDLQQILFDLQPSGLRFDPAEPAELDIEYGHAGDDLDKDGDVDAEDDRIETELAIWRQEVAGGVFEQLGSVKFEDLREIEVLLTGFTRYAIAY
jgi:hypothetical protein